MKHHISKFETGEEETKETIQDFKSRRMGVKPPGGIHKSGSMSSLKHERKSRNKRGLYNSKSSNASKSQGIY